MSEILQFYDQAKLEAYARAMTRPVNQVAKGLAAALYEAGPNHFTELADAMAAEGNPLMEPKVRASWEALGQFRFHLTEFLHNRSAVFVGGLAVCSYGARPGPTSDFDVLIDPMMAKEMSAFLEREGGKLTQSSDNMLTFSIVPANTHCELLLSNHPLYKEAYETFVEDSFCDSLLRVATPGPLAAMKVKAYRDRRGFPKGGQDRHDVTYLIRSGATSKEGIETILTRHSSELLEVLRQIGSA